MPKTQIVKISSDGRSVSGLYADFLQVLGEMRVQRASAVEFNGEIGRWTVEPKIGPLAGTCLVQTFAHRTSALAAEVALLTEQHRRCLL